MDRERQRIILEGLRSAFPRTVYREDMMKFATRMGELEWHLAYLEDHGLVEARWTPTMGKTHLSNARITSKGIDFLADDGGLSAVLGVVTVRLHEDSVKQLMLAKIDASDADPSVKGELRDTVTKLPAEALRSVVMRVLDSALSDPATTIAALRTSLGL